MYCFGCNQPHDPNTCVLVAGIIANHPEYKIVLHATSANQISIPQEDCTLLIDPGFALLFHHAGKKVDTTLSSSIAGRSGRGETAARKNAI